MLASDVAESAKKKIYTPSMRSARSPPNRAENCRAGSSSRQNFSSICQIKTTSASEQTTRQLAKPSAAVREAASKMTIDKFDTRLFVFSISPQPRERESQQDTVISFSHLLHWRAKNISPLSCLSRVPHTPRGKLLYRSETSIPYCARFSRHRSSVRVKSFRRHFSGDIICCVRPPVFRHLIN